MNRKLVVAAAIGALTISYAASDAKAATYNPLDAFQVIGNQLVFANFQVGDFSGGALTPAGVIQENGYAGVVDVAWGATAFGGAYKNSSGVPFQFGTNLFAADRLHLHAGSGDIALAFVAPNAGEFSFIGQFSSQDTNYASKTVSALDGSDTLFSHLLVKDVNYNFSFARTLAAGEKVYFVLGGPGYASTLTGLRLTVNDAAVVPEPATWAMMVSGFGVAGFTARRRTCKAVALA